jgi:hypothetical protein
MEFYGIPRNFIKILQNKKHHMDSGFLSPSVKSYAYPSVNPYAYPAIYPDILYASLYPFLYPSICRSLQGFPWSDDHCIRITFTEYKNTR